MNRIVVFGLAMFFALVGLALVGGENKASAFIFGGGGCSCSGGGCHARHHARCHGGGRCHGGCHASRCHGGGGCHHARRCHGRCHGGGCNGGGCCGGYAAAPGKGEMAPTQAPMEKQAPMQAPMQAPAK